MLVLRVVTRGKHRRKGSFQSFLLLSSADGKSHQGKSRMVLTHAHQILAWVVRLGEELLEFRLASKLGRCRLKGSRHWPRNPALQRPICVATPRRANRTSGGRPSETLTSVPMPASSKPACETQSGPGRLTGSVHYSGGATAAGGGAKAASGSGGARQRSTVPARVAGTRRRSLSRRCG